MAASGRRRRIWLLAAAVLALAAAAWYLWPGGARKAAGGHAGHHAGPGGAASRDQPAPVRVAVVARGDIRVTASGLGTVTPIANVVVRTQINGLLLQLGFVEGQMVRRGDFLAQIDPRPYQVALAQAEGALARDQALLREARLDLARYRKLLAQDSIAAQQVDTQAALVRQYEGTVVSDQAAIDGAKLNLVYCHITAPVSGRVGLRQVDAGNYVQTGDANGLVVLTQLQPISVVFALPEDELPAIAARVQTGARLPVTASDRADSHALATGALAALDNQIDTTTGTVKLRAIFDNAEGALFPNQFVNASLLVDTHKAVPTVPAAAIQRGAPGSFAYVVGADGAVAIRTLQLGPQDGDRVEIRSGLQEGDRVVVDGADKLRAGMRVRVAGEGTADRRHGPAPVPPAREAR